MPVQIGAKPDSGFDDPIGMLKDCHRRIEDFLHILCVVAERARGRALTDEESAAVHAAIQYFHVGGRRHNADEEESLFPRLKACMDSSAIAEMQHLEDDHREAEQLHGLVENLYAAWINDGLCSREVTAQLLSCTQQLRQLYQAHIAVEEQQIFQRASELFDKVTISAIGEEFRRRRI